MNYQFLLSKNRKTPQNQPIPGREAEMVQGRSGGWMFQADSWSVLRRCLLIGTAQSTFYADQHELTTEFVAVLNQAIALDPDRVAQEILYASDGHALNKPADRAEARAMLRQLSGRTHTVFTGLALRHHAKGVRVDRGVGATGTE